MSAMVASRTTQSLRTAALLLGAIAAVIDRILRHLGVPTEMPAPRPARAPPFCGGSPDQAGWDDGTPVFDPCF